MGGSVVKGEDSLLGVIMEAKEEVDLDIGTIECSLQCFSGCRLHCIQ